MTIESLLRQYAWNLAYAEALTADVPAELWARSGGEGLENHPAWTIGHLVTGSLVNYVRLLTALTGASTGSCSRAMRHACRNVRLVADARARTS